MALRLKPETREAWRVRVALAHLRDHAVEHSATSWRPVPRAEPAPEKRYDTHTYDIYRQTWVDT